MENNSNVKIYTLGGSPGLVVLGGDLKVVGSNPSIEQWMDIFTNSCCKNCNVCLKSQK